jgi:hypothetical protein
MRKNAIFRTTVFALAILPVILFMTSANAQIGITGPYWNTPTNPTNIPTYTDGNVWIGNNNPSLIATTPGATAHQSAGLNIEKWPIEYDRENHPGQFENAPAVAIANFRHSNDILDDNVVQIYGVNLTTGDVEPFFYIDPKGKTHIGIDPTSHSIPTGFSLYVREGILTERVKVATVNSAEWPDYVFADSYDLMSLGQLEAFVNDNKHLPNVPSAAEVNKDGIDLVEMDAKLLRKIEELTLYLIDLKKDNDELRKQVSELKK